MSFNLASPVTGLAQTGFTAPTYSMTVDTSPSNNSKQWAVTALGGTQVGVDAHSVSKPFTISVFRPVVLKTLPQANPVTGVIKNIPTNTYKVITRKGASPAASQSALVPRVYTVIEVPAGTDTYEPEDLKAMLSLHFGALSAQSAGIGDMVISGIM